MIGRYGRWAVLLWLLTSWCRAEIQAGWLDPRFDLPGANGNITSLLEFHGRLYAVGIFTRIAGVDAPGVAVWDGTNWIAFKPGLNANVYAAVATEDGLYFVGATGQQPPQPSGLLRWDGQTWTALGTPAGYRDVLGHALLASGTNVYCEVCPEPGPSGLNANKALAKWNGSDWSILGITSKIGGSGLYAIALVHGSLYGYFSGFGSRSTFCRRRLHDRLWVKRTAPRFSRSLGRHDLDQYRRWRLDG